MVSKMSNFHLILNNYLIFRLFAVTGCSGYVVLQPKMTIADSLLKKVKITINIICTTKLLFQSDNQLDILAVHIPFTSCFTFSFNRPNGNYYNGNGYNFRIEIKVTKNL